MAGGLRANPPLADGSLHLTVANPSQTWQANRPLSLGESVQLSVTAEPAGRTSQQAPLLHLQSLRVTPSSLTKTIWIPVGPASIRALHLGQCENTFTAEISAVWVEQQAAGPGGGGGLSQLASQYGTARGTATSKNPSFSWTAVQPRHQFNDGSSRIQFLANAESNIAGVTLSGSGYKVSTSVGTLHGGSLNSAGSFAGEVSSIAAGSTRLSIAWTGQGVTKELARSRGIAFSDIDMKAKAGPGASEVLAEDRVKPTTSPDDPASNPDGNHEMAPGTFAFLLPSSSTNVTRTEVIIGKQLSATTPARAKLESQGLPSLVVSTDVEGNATLSLPAAWPNANAIPSTIYLHGTTDAQNPPTQKGTLTLTLEVELKDDIQTAPFSNQPSTEKSWHKIVEKIGVTLLPVQIKVNSANPPAGTSGAKYANPDRPTEVNADNLFSVWPGEDFTVKVKLPDSFQLPTGLIKWTVAGESVPDNTKEHTFNWNTTGTKHIKISVGESTFNVWVDLPNVGSLSQGDALLAVDPISSSSLALYGAIALTHANQAWPTAVPKKDATRHSYWTAMCASDILVSNAAVLLVTTAHEYNNKFGVPNFFWQTGAPQDAFNSTMDLRNNLIGLATVHFTVLGTPDYTAILQDLDNQYQQGLMWIYGGSTTETASEGILKKSNQQKIYAP